MGSVRHFRRIGAALVALSLSACGGGGTGAGTASSVPAASSVHGNLAFSITVPPSSASQSKSRSAQFVSAATKSVSIATGSSTTNIDVGPASAGCSVNVAQPSIGENAIAAGAQPRGITKGPDGTMWFVEDSGGAIGNLTTGGTYQRFPSGLLTNDLVVGPDGFLWIAQLFGALEILRFNTSGTTFISPYSTGSQPQATHLATGSDNNVYYTPFPSSNALYRMTSSGSPGGAFPTFGAPVALTLGPDGAIWFTESNGTNAWIGRLTTAGSLNQFPLPVTAPQYITAGSDGALWFTESSTNKVYRMTTSGAVTASFAITSGGSAAIVNGPDGALWFTEFNANLIGRLTTAGALTEFSVPTASSGPTNLAFSADGTLYFTEQSANNIGTLRLFGFLHVVRKRPRGKHHDEGYGLRRDGRRIRQRARSLDADSCRHRPGQRHDDLESHAQRRREQHFARSRGFEPSQRRPGNDRVAGARCSRQCDRRPGYVRRPERKSTDRNAQRHEWRGDALRDRVHRAARDADTTHLAGLLYRIDDYTVRYGRIDHRCVDAARSAE
jgi:virginiamycin B lyase